MLQMKLIFCSDAAMNACEMKNSFASYKCLGTPQRTTAILLNAVRDKLYKTFPGVIPP